MSEIAKHILERLAADLDAHDEKLTTPCEHVWDVQTERVPESGVPEPSTVTCQRCGDVRRVNITFTFHKA